MTGSKLFQVWSFEFPYCVFLYKDKPRLGSILHPRYLDRGIPRNIFRVELRGSQFVSSFDRSREILLDSQDYSSNTEILPFIQQHDIGHKTWANRDPDTTCKSFWKKSLCQYKNELLTESPSVSVLYHIVMQSRFIAPLHYQFHSLGIISS